MNPAIPILVVACLAVGCTGSGAWVSYQSTSRGTVTWTVDGEVYHVETRGRDQAVRVAVYRDGQLLGAEGLTPAARRRLDWLDLEDRPVIDHPMLPAWRDGFAQLEALSRETEPAIDAFVTAAARLPFEAPVSARAAAFCADRPDRAAGLLDGADVLELAEPTVAELVAIAVQDPEVDDARLARWLEIEQIVDNGDAVVAIARSEAAGIATSSAILANLDEVDSDRRAEAFELAGARLAGDPAHARMLVRSLDELYGDDRARAALGLLARAEVDAQLAVEILDHIDDFYGDDRPRVFVTAARLAHKAPGAPRLIALRLSELYGDDRTTAALTLLGEPATHPRLAEPITGRIGEFYGDDRLRVLEAVIAGPGFRGPVQRAVIRAAAGELYGDDRARVLAAVEAHAELEPDALALLRRVRNRDR